MSSDLPLLKLHRGLTIGYKRPLASLPGEIDLSAGTHFLLARNGRGKTTLLRTVARALKALSGSFETRGRMQYIPEDLRFDPELTPASIFRALLPHRHKDALDLAAEAELDVKKPYGKLSTGNRRKTALILAECSAAPDNGNILLLDEPFSGLDAHVRAIFEARWQADTGRVLRLVSCHPDYDSMPMTSALLIQDGHILHTANDSQTWSDLKSSLN